MTTSHDAERPRASSPLLSLMPDGAVPSAAFLVTRLWALLADVPADAARNATGNGAAARTAFHAYDAATKNLRFDVLHTMGVELPPDFFPEPDWTAIAEEMGEPVDLAAWRAFADRDA